VADNDTDHPNGPDDPGRRRFVAGAGVMTALAGLTPLLGLTACDQSSDAAPAGSVYGLTDGPFDVDITLRAHPDTVPILEGPKSEVWRYTGERIAGPADTLTAVSDSYPGPLICLRRGQRFRARLHNELPEATTVHWHGLHVPPDVDGQPRLPIAPSESMTVGLEVRDRAGLYWYHPHPHGEDGGRVGFQAVAGLAGPLIIEDEQERSLNLPRGEHEMVLMLQDRRFNDANELEYLGGDAMGGMMTRMHGFRGDHILVNGQPNAQRSVATRAYRLRIANGSNARIYSLAWSDGRPVSVIGTDGGLLAAPQQQRHVTLAPAQRVDIWVDFSNDAVGSEVQLISESHDATMGMMGSNRRGSGMMGGGMMNGGMMGSERFPLVRFTVDQSSDGGPALPNRLATDLTEPDRDAPVRGFELSQRMMQGFTINGRQMNGTQVADDEITTLGAHEVWEFSNNSMMAHPMHIHGLQFQVIERIGGRSGPLRDGVIDSGLHDTVLVFPGERVRLALQFEDFTGLYMLHCHNMEHEDNGMMRYYRVDPADRRS